MEYEINILERAEANNDPAELKKLEGNIAAYRRIESGLLKLTVPKSALQIHMDFTNAASNMAQSITGLSYILSDPMKAVPGVTGYGENFQSFFTALYFYKKYFEDIGTIFDSTDVGYHFFDSM